MRRVYDRDTYSRVRRPLSSVVVADLSREREQVVDADLRVDRIQRRLLRRIKQRHVATTVALAWFF